MSDNQACMIWTEGGVWLQTVGDDGRMRLSSCGRISRVSVENFCRARGIGFSVRVSPGPATAAGSHKSVERKLAPVS